VQRKTLFYLTSLPFQISISLLPTIVVGIAILLPAYRVDISHFDRSTFISILGAIATLVTLFCSLSLTWILFNSQQVRHFRTDSFDLMKQCLLDTDRWLETQEVTQNSELCRSLIWEINKIEFSDLPQLGSIPEYNSYCELLKDSFEFQDEDTRLFIERSALYFTRIEQLLSRFGVTSIQQILLDHFIYTLAKGLAIVASSVVVLVCSILWFGEFAKILYVLFVTFVSTATILLLYEVLVDVILEYRDTLDEVDQESEIRFAENAEE